MELRFAVQLQGSSANRYAGHCGQREEDLHHAMAAGLGEDDDLLAATEQVSVKIKKNRRLLSGKFFRDVRDRITRHHDPELGRRSSSSVQYNAGELHIRVRLVLFGSWWDSAFSLALQPRDTKFTQLL